MAALGMKRPFTSSVPGDEFKALAAPIIAELGPIPHGRLHFRGGVIRGAGGVEADAGAVDGSEEPESTGPKKQTTRLVKCECETCGYVARTTRKWLDEKGAPHCPDHGAMKEAA